MENASKALIIAGAILLSIVIIALGMYVFNMSKETVDSVNMDAQEIATYNSQFNSYLGDKISGTRVKALLSTIQNHNRLNTDVSRQITYGATILTAIPKSVTNVTDAQISAIQTGATYKVVAGYDKSSGILISIQVTKQ